MFSSAKDRCLYPLVPYRRRGGEAVKSPRAICRYTWHAPFYLLLVADVATVTYDISRRHALFSSCCIVRDMEHNFKHGVRALPFVSLLILFVVINVTDPTKNVTSILLVFLLLYAFFASLFYLVLHELLHKIKFGTSVVSTGRMPHQRAYYIASALAFVPVILLAMQSLQQVKVFDIALVGVLISLVVFYIVKRT